MKDSRRFHSWPNTEWSKGKLLSFVLTSQEIRTGNISFSFQASVKKIYQIRKTFDKLGNLSSSSFTVLSVCLYVSVTEKLEKHPALIWSIVFRTRILKTSHNSLPSCWRYENLKNSISGISGCSLGIGDRRILRLLRTILRLIQFLMKTLNLFAKKINVIFAGTVTNVAKRS